METSPQLNRIEQFDSGRDYQFTDLNDDVLRDIFKYIDGTQRTNLEVLCRRFGELLPTLCSKLDGDEFPFLYCEGYEETTRFIHLAAKSSAIKHVDLGLISHDALLSIMIADSRRAEWFAAVLKNTIESLSLRLTDLSSSNVHFAAEYARSLGVNCGIKCLDLAFSSYFIRNIHTGLTRFTALVESCPKLEKLKILVQDSNEDDNSVDSAFHRLVRDDADTMWCTIASKVQQVEIKHFESPYFKFGSLHYTGHSWTNLIKVTIEYQLTPVYLKQLVENAPKLESVSLTVEDLTSLNTISKLNSLNSVKLRCSEISESDSVRRSNCTFFLNFLIRRGRQLKELNLKIPYQDNGFFEPVMELCNQSLVTKLHLKGSPKRTMDIGQLVKLPNIRRLQLDAAVKVETIRFILESCPKLRKFDFVIPAFQRSSMESVKSDILSYSANHPGRLIMAKIETSGLTCYHRCEDFRVERCMLRMISDFESQY
ncbi:hypothetical protein HDE_01152 [Halotydeus destructor]|nr:hypothetical protein HDE_01152 [Halotydeus destructor]